MAKKKEEENGKLPEGPDMVPFLRGVLRQTLDDTEARERFPHLVELMAPRYKDGALTRQEGSIRLTVRSGLWHVTLECPSERVKCTYSGASLLHLWEGFEAALEGAGVVWEETFKKRQKDLRKLDARIQ